MNNVLKQKELKNLVQICKPSVVCLQETNIDPLAHRVPSLQGYVSFFNPPVSSFNGTCVYVLSTLSVKSETIVSTGCLQHIVIETESSTLHVLNMHLPHDESKAIKTLELMENILKKIPPNDYVLAAGDWNVVENDKMDRLRCKEKRQKVLRKMDYIISSCSIIDSYRVLHPYGNEMTHISRNFAHLPAARLDRVYIKTQNANTLMAHKVIPFCSDHACVQINFSLSDHGKGGLWKFNNDLLKCDSYIFQVNSLLHEFLNCEPKSIHDYDILKSNIKSAAKSTMNYIKDEERRALRKYQRIFQQNILSANSHSNLFHELVSDKNISLLKTQMKASANLSSVTIDRALNHMEKEAQLQFVHNYFQGKFGTPTETCTTDLDHYLEDLPKLSVPVNHQLSSPISEEEVLKTIKKLPTKKSPGSDGLTSEFYIMFAPQFAKIIVGLYEQCSQQQQPCLPKSMRTGVVTLICKKGDARELKNWRPITLCNVDYKIIATVIKNRLIPHMTTVVGDYQTCNIKHRSIFDNLLYFRELLDSNFTGGILSLDQEAAFDRVNREYLYSVMRTMNFPEPVISAVKLLYNRSCITVKIGASYTESINVVTGVKQGGPVSSLLFVLSFEPFLRSLQSTLSLQRPLNSANPYVGVTAYADDCHIVITNSNDGDLIEKELKLYCKFSGGKLHRTKSSCLMLGAWSDQPPKISFPVTTEGTKILGIDFGPGDYGDRNWSSLLNSFKVKMAQLATKYKETGIHIKATVLNNFLLPLLWYKLQVLNPPDKFLQEIVDLTLQFLWGSGKHWVNKRFVFAPTAHGGLGLKHPIDQINTFRLRLVRRILFTHINEYFLQNIRTTMSKLIFTGVLTDDSYYTKIQAALKLTKAKLLRIPSETLGTIRFNDLFFPPQDVKALKSVEIHTAEDLSFLHSDGNPNETIPTHKRRIVEKSGRAILKVLLSYSNNNKSGEPPTLSLYNPLTQSDEEI